jgi:hypothetical protein
VLYELGDELADNRVEEREHLRHIAKELISKPNFSEKNQFCRW